MINKIRIYYNSSEIHTCCFWKIFFEICGIYVTERNIDTNENVIRDGIMLFLLGKDCRNLISNCENKETVYLVSDSVAFDDFPARKDIIAFNIDENKEDREQQALYILNRLFCECEEKKYLCRLMQIFIKQQLWGTVWLFQEITRRNSHIFDKRIKYVCDETMTLLQKDQYYKKSQHFHFMYLYCKQMKIEVSALNLSEKYQVSQELLNACSELSKTERGWDIPLCLSAGNICTLSIVDEKHALNFYKMACKIEKSAKILYEIGTGYEKIYGNSQKALDYYKEVYKMDKTCFKALYKLAFENEKQHNWIQALKQYQSILKYEEYPIVHIEDILCLHKTNIRISAIYKKYFSDNISYIHHLENMDGNIYWIQNKLSDLMCDMSIEDVDEVKRAFLEELKL